MATHHSYGVVGGGGCGGSYGYGSSSSYPSRSEIADYIDLQVKTRLENAIYQQPVQIAVMRSNEEYEKKKTNKKDKLESLISYYSCKLSK
jgi:hypothetical protein